MKLDDIRVEGSKYQLSLSKLCGGRAIADIHGYLSSEFGEPTFKMSKVIFADGTELGCEGEHDMPYLVQYGRDKELCPLPDDETMQALMDEDE